MDDREHLTGPGVRARRAWRRSAARRGRRGRCRAAGSRRRAPRRSVGAGPAETSANVPGLHHAAVLEDHEPVGERGRVERIVGHEEPHPGERRELGPQLAAHRRRARSGRARRAARRAAAAAARWPWPGPARPAAPDRRRAPAASRARDRPARPARATPWPRLRAAARPIAAAAEPERDVLEHGEVREAAGSPGRRRRSAGAPGARTPGPRRRATTPSSSMRPRSIGRSPASARSNVVLPAPFGPRIATVSPSSALELDVEVERPELRARRARRGSSDTEPAVAQEREDGDAHGEQHDAQTDRDLAASTRAGGRPRAASSGCGPGCCRRR